MALNSQLLNFKNFADCMVLDTQQLLLTIRPQMGLLRKLKDGTMTDRLSLILFQYRITPQTTMAPAEILLGRRLKSRLDIILRPSLDE